MKRVRRAVMAAPPGAVIERQVHIRKLAGEAVAPRCVADTGSNTSCIPDRRAASAGPRHIDRLGAKAKYGLRPETVRVAGRVRCPIFSRNRI
jgi:hypothetical protein